MRGKGEERRGLGVEYGGEGGNTACEVGEMMPVLETFNWGGSVRFGI